MASMRRFVRGLKKGLDDVMAPAEDPRQTYAYTVERQRELLTKVQRALADIGATKRRLEGQTTEVRAKLPLLENRARQSLRQGNEAQARLSLQRYQLAAAELRRLEQQLQETELEEQRLWLTEQRLSSQLEAFYARQELIEARYSAAEAQVQIGEALTGVSEELAELSRAMESAERKSEHMEARAAAIDRLVDDGYLEMPAAINGIGDEHLLPSGLDSDVEDHLQELKRELV